MEDEDPTKVRHSDPTLFNEFFAERMEQIPMLRLFPSIFTACMFMVYMIPAFTLYYIAKQPVVRYWSADYTDWTLFIPFFMVFAHQYHLRYGPNQIVTTFMLIFPSALLLILAGITNAGAAGDSQALSSIDCDINHEKALLQLEWEAAQAFYDTCIANTALKPPYYNIFWLKKQFRIQDCANYDAVYQKHEQSWSYLREMEEKYFCTGWCVPGEQLWSSGTHKDSCAVAASAVFEYFVQSRAGRITFIMLLILVPAIAMFAILEPVLKSMGYDFDW